MTLAERFWSKVDKRGARECWPWTGAKYTGGYGKFAYGKRGSNRGAHRIAWMLTHGSEASEDVCHHCDNPPCCNPAHLFVGTARDNIQDMIRKGRRVQPAHVPPPMHGEQNPMAKLSYAKASEIRHLRKTTTLSQAAIGSKFGVSPQLVSRVCANEIWRQ